MTGGFIRQEEMYLFNQGEFYHSYLKFGAHIVTVNHQKGVHFAVWAPNARRVSVVGDFNHWQGEKHPMELQNPTGIWTLFIPGLAVGELYKYEIESQNDEVFLKADPFAFYAEMRPHTASIVYSFENYAWGDGHWLEKRKGLFPTKRPENEHGSPFENELGNAPILIYEVHIGSWRQKPDGSFYNYRELAVELIPYMQEMGFTHLELLPVMEYPYDGSWGYQITGYYAATSRYGTPEDLMYLIDQCHQAGIGVILDWVPGHFCKDAHGLARFDGTMLFEKEEHQDWGTHKFDFSRREVWSFLISNALFWLENYHIDGLRVDGVTSMLMLDFGQREGEWQPNPQGGRENLQAISFLHKLNQVIKSYYPDVMTIAEESSDWPNVTGAVAEGGLGFDYKWNMGWMNDTLRYMSQEFSKRKYCHGLLTFSMIYAYSENFILPFSHDEVVHSKRSLLNKMPGDYWQKFAGFRLLYLYQICHPGGKLVFMGAELGQFIEWRYYSGLEWFLLEFEQHRQLQGFVRSLNNLYHQEPGLWENNGDWSGFEWIDVDNENQSILVFLRKADREEDNLLVVLNFLPDTHENFRIGVPLPGEYREVFNSDSSVFGGSNQRNRLQIQAENINWHGRNYSIRITVPPLAGVLFKRCAT